MKKTAILLLLFSLLTACDGNSGNNKRSKVSSSTRSSVTAKSIKRVIKASELISKEDAASLVDQIMKDDEMNKRPLVDQNRYVSKDYGFSVALCQEALHDSNSDFEKGLLKKGWASYMKEMEKAYSLNYHNQNIVEMDGIEGASYLQDGVAMGLWLLHIFYGDYYILVTLGNTSLSRKDSEAETAWKQEKLKEAGNLAVRRLKAIISK